MPLFWKVQQSDLKIWLNLCQELSCKLKVNDTLPLPSNDVHIFTNHYGYIGAHGWTVHMAENCTYSHFHAWHLRTWRMVRMLKTCQMLQFLLKSYSLLFWLFGLSYMTEANIMAITLLFKYWYFLLSLFWKYLQQLKPVEVYACFFLHVFYSLQWADSCSESADDADDNTNMKVGERTEGAALWEVLTPAVTFILSW